MIKRAVAAVSLALLAILFVASVGAAKEIPPIVDSGIVEKVECFFRVYIQEGGESGLDCFI